MISAATRKRVGRVQGQLELRKMDKNGQWRGGRRPGAGRKRTSTKARHRKRPEISRHEPQHVTLKVLGRVGWLRRRDMYNAIRVALMGLSVTGDFRVVHYSLQNDHIHLLCEADNKRALRSGIASFEISAALRINVLLSRRRRRKECGPVFADRYHVESIDSIAQTRNCLNYVFNNWRKHGCDKREPGIFNGRLDPYSSAIVFPGWKERTHKRLHLPDGVPVPIVSRPRTWLLREGWKRASSPLSVYDVPKRRSA